MNFIKVIVLALCLVTNALAQSKVDSLLNIANLKDGRNKYVYHDTLRFNALSKIGREITKTDPDSAFYYYELALKVAEHIKNDLKIIQTYRNIGWNYYLTGEYEKSILHYNDAIKLIDLSLINKSNENEKRRFWVQKCIIFGNLGMVYTNLTEYVLALEYHFKALELAEKLDRKIGISSSYVNIGNIYFRQNDYNKTLEYYLKALDIQNQSNSKADIATTLSNIGVVYHALNDDENTLLYYQKSFDIYKTANDLDGMALIYGNLGNFYSDRKENDKALKYYLDAFNLYEKLGHKFGLTTVSGNLGSQYTVINRYKEARYYIDKSFELAKEIESVDDIMQAHYNYFELYQYKKEHSDALEHYLRYIQIRDSLKNEDNVREILSKEIKFNYSKKAVADSVNNAKAQEIKNIQIAKQKAEIKAKKNQQYALSGGLVLLIAFLVFVYNRLQITRKQKEIITLKEQETQKQKHELEEKNHEILQSINYAKRLQQSILPPPRLVKEYMKDSFVLYMPKDIVAGDFYWIESHNNKIYFAAADCTGHGVPGAMVSMVCHNALNRALLEFNLLSPSLILDKASEIVEETFSKSEDNVQDGMDVSLYCLDTATLHLEWAGANNPLWMIQNGEFKEIKADKQPVGRYENRKPFTNHVLQLNEGDSLFSITDGYPDQFGGAQGKKYTYKKLREYLLKINNKPMALQKDDLIAEFDRWKLGQDQVDDVCIIGVKI